MFKSIFNGIALVLAFLPAALEITCDAMSA